MTKQVHSALERYPGYDSLSQQDHWDPATRRLVLDRVHNVPPIRFFNAQELETVQALVEVVLPQDDRPPDRRVPIAAYIDEMQYKGETPGYRYEGMPDGRTAWHLGLEGVEQASRALYGGRRTVELSPDERHELVLRLQRGDVPGEAWHGMPARRFFSDTLMAAVISAYYGHPYAWDEIGYGGPAYPRGYYALNFGAREHWEVDERR